MPLFLIPVAAAGYKVWEHRKRKAEEAERQENEEVGEPSRVVDTLPSEVDDKVQQTTQDDNDTKDASCDDTVELIDSNSSAADDDDQTRSTMDEEEQQGPLSGFRKFFDEKMEERRGRELQKQKNRELAEKIARGEMPVALPKISYK